MRDYPLVALGVFMMIIGGVVFMMIRSLGPLSVFGALAALWGAMFALWGDLKPVSPPVTKEVYRETIIREIDKIRCRNCGTLFEEKSNRCPSCGAPS